MKNTDFWKDVNADFNVLCMALSGFNLPTPAEIDRYWASLASSAFESSLKERLQVGYTVYPGDEERQEVIREALSTVQDKKIIANIRKGIQTQTCGLDFFWAWTAYQKSAAVLLSMYLVDKAAQEDFNRQDGQFKRKCAVIQKYIYAHWIYSRWARPVMDGVKLEKNARFSLNQSLAYEIQQILADGTALTDDEREWLESMIERQAGRDPELKGKALKLTAKDICELVENGGIGKDELPPLFYI